MFEIVMGIDDFLIQLVKYWIYIFFRIFCNGTVSSFMLVVIVMSEKIGRNDLCSCGSGKKV